MSSALTTSQAKPCSLINKLVVAAILYFGAKLVIDGSLAIGELVAFNMLASRVSAPVLRLAQMWQDFHQARLSIDRLGDILNTLPERNFNPGARCNPGYSWRDHVRARQFPLQHRQSGGTYSDVSFR